MHKKLRLDPDVLAVTSFVAGEAESKDGTVHGQVIDPWVAFVTRTNCLTTPCCPATVSCPSGAVTCLTP
jgi:hypothetical protein